MQETKKEEILEEVLEDLEKESHADQTEDSEKEAETTEEDTASETEEKDTEESAEETEETSKEDSDDNKKGFFKKKKLIISSNLSLPASKNVLVIREYDFFLYDSLLPFPVGVVPNSLELVKSEIPFTNIPSLIICVSPANTPSSSKK